MNARQNRCADPAIITKTAAAAMGLRMATASRIQSRMKHAQ